MSMQEAGLCFSSQDSHVLQGELIRPALLARPALHAGLADDPRPSNSPLPRSSSQGICSLQRVHIVRVQSAS